MMVLFKMFIMVEVFGLVIMLAVIILIYDVAICAGYTVVQMVIVQLGQ